MIQHDSTHETPQQRRQAQTRRDILEAALSVIVREGISGLSVRSLADRIDYTPGALYTYFNSKEELIDAVRSESLERLGDFLRVRTEGLSSTREMLLEAGLAYVDFAADHPNEYYLMFGLEPSHSTSGERRTHAMRSLLDILHRGVEEGSIVTTRDYTLETIALHCWVTVHGLASLQTTVLADEKNQTAQAARSILKKVVDVVFAR